MPTELLLVKDGNRLAPADPITDEIVSGLERKRQYRAMLSNPRNGAHHRLIMCLLHMCWQNQTQRVFATQDQLLAAIKVDTGLRHTVTSFTGLPFIMPDSISFAAMPQHVFAAWVSEKLMPLVTETILPGMLENDIKREIEALLANYD